MLSTRTNYPRESAGVGTKPTTTARSGFDTVGIEVYKDQARLLFGIAPETPRVVIPLAKVALSGDLGDLNGFLDVALANVDQLTSNFINSDGADIETLQNTSIDTESITTNGTEVYVDWNATATKLPVLAIQNNPLVSGKNSDGTKGGFSLENMLIGAAESVGTEAALYFAKSAGGWLMSLGQDAFSLFNGYASLSEAGLSIGGSAASTAAAAGGDLALFESGSEGLVMASSASEAASMFSSAGVLSELGTGFATEAGEAGEGLLSGITSSTAEFEEVLASHDLVSSLAGTARWVSF